MSGSTGFEEESIDLSIRLGLAVEDHLALNGIRPSSAQGKRLAKAFEERMDNPMPPPPIEQEGPQEEDVGNGPGQPSLMDF